MLMNVLVMCIHVTVMPTALTTLVVFHVTATQGILEVAFSAKVSYLTFLCTYKHSILRIQLHQSHWYKSAISVVE